MKFLMIFTAVIAGGLIPLQTAQNSLLARTLNNALLASAFVFLVAFLFLAVSATAMRTGMASMETLREVPTIAWMGGILCAVCNLMMIYTVPHLGGGLTTTLVVLGQVIAGLLIDHYGLLGLPQNSLNAGRLIALALIGGGVALLQRN